MRTAAPRAAALSGGQADLAMAYSGGLYYLFTTGPGIPVRRSHDLKSWQDQGPEPDSRQLTDTSGVPSDYNAIDPNVIIDADGLPHPEFGSFYGGLKPLNLDPATGPGRPSQSTPCRSPQTFRSTPRSKGAS
jgi:arabinan endo-1,5-alpha-L-arabinosidase